MLARHEKPFQLPRQTTIGSMQRAWTTNRAAVISAAGIVAIASLEKMSMIGDTSTDRNISRMPVETSEAETGREEIPWLIAKSFGSGSRDRFVAPVGECGDGRVRSNFIQRFVAHVLIYLCRDTGEAMRFQ